MIANIVSGAPNLWLPESLEGYIIGTDRGALTLIEKGYQIEVAIGDFDSVSTEELSIIKNSVSNCIILPKEKDITDTEAAIDYAIEKGFTKIKLYGTFGARIDHEYASLLLMLKYTKRNISISMANAQNNITVLKPGIHEFETVGFSYISFFAMDETVKNLSLQKVKYPLSGFDLSVDNSLCVSNEPVEKSVEIAFDAGFLLVVESMEDK